MLSALIHRSKPRAQFERGASAVEYALLIAGVAAVLVVVIVTLGGEVQGMFEDTCTDIEQAARSSNC
ncbi:Flp family type IVb pilin [Nocardioides sp.]|uniref:Flp family type IVb pilin n=1 Tax=Nocardioides sp. TaxID=35761 RepID=UPI00321BE092